MQKSAFINKGKTCENRWFMMLEKTMETKMFTTNVRWLPMYNVGCVYQKRNLPQTYYVSLDPWSEKEYLTHEVAWAYYPLYFDAVLQLPVTVPHFDCGSLFELHKDLAEIVVVRRLQQRRRRQLRLPGKLPRLENHHHPAKNWVKNIYKGLFICFFKVYVYFAKTFKLV